MYKIQKGEIATFIAIITLIGITVLTFITASTTSNIAQKQTVNIKAEQICDKNPVVKCDSGYYVESKDACCSTSWGCRGYEYWEPDLGPLCDTNSEYSQLYGEDENATCCGEISNCSGYWYGCDDYGYSYDSTLGSCCRESAVEPVNPGTITCNCSSGGYWQGDDCGLTFGEPCGDGNNYLESYTCGCVNNIQNDYCESPGEPCDLIGNTDEGQETYTACNEGSCENYCYYGTESTGQTGCSDAYVSNGVCCKTTSYEGQETYTACNEGSCENYCYYGTESTGQTGCSDAYVSNGVCCKTTSTADNSQGYSYCDDPGWCFSGDSFCPSSYDSTNQNCVDYAGPGVCCKNKTYVDDTTSNLPADTCNGQCEDGACNTLTGMTYGVGQCFNSANPYCCISENVTDNRQLDSTENTCYSGVCVYSSCEYNNMVSEPGNCGGGYSCCIEKETETMNDLRQFEANNVACDSGDCWVGWEYCDSPDFTSWTQSGTCKVSGNPGVCCVEKATQGMGDLKTYESNNISCDSGNCYVGLSECDDNYYTQTGVCKDGGNDGVCCVEKATQGMGDLKTDESQTTGSEPCEYLGGECKADWSTLYNSEYEKNPKGGSCSSEIFSGWGQSCYRLISAATEETNSTKEKTCQELGGDECRANLPGWNSEYVKISDGGCGSFGDLYQSCYRKLIEGEVAPTEDSCTGDGKECIYDTLGGQPIGYTKISSTGCGPIGNYLQSCYQKVDSTSLEEATTGRNCQQIEGAICSADLLGDVPIGYIKTESSGCDLLSFPKQACYIPKSATESNASEGGACIKSGGKCMFPSEIDETKYKLKTDVDCTDIDMSGGTLCYEQIGATVVDKKPCADLEGGKCMVSSEIDVTKFKPLEGGDCTEDGEGMSCYGPIGTTGGQGTLLINGMLYDGPFTFSTGTITFSNIPNTYTKENPAIVNIDVSEKEVVVDDVNDLGYRINFNEPYENLDTNQEATVFSGE